MIRHPTTGDPLDSALILRFDGPDSATGEDICEYHCHGGRAVVTAVIATLTSLPGMRVARPGEFTRRALANGRIDLTEAEGLADLLEAETESQRRAALAMAGGALSRQVDSWQRCALVLSARAEAAIDYVGDEDETATDTSVLGAEARSLGAELDDWLARPRVEPLRNGIRVVIAGPPNVGKSSLLNALVGTDRAIVTAVPGTTRDTIEVPCAIDGVPLLLVDTAGLRATNDPIEEVGIARARHAAGQADILLWLGQPDEAPVATYRIIVQSKADIAAPVRGAELAVSARTALNLDRLSAAILALSRQLLPEDNRLALNQRQAEALTSAAEALRCPTTDLLIIAESLRAACAAFDRLTGKAGVDEALDMMFTRFCLGK